MSDADNLESRDPAPSDAELLDRAREHDWTAFSELVNRHRATCLRQAIFMLRLRDEAEDEVQNATWKAFEHVDQYKGTGEFSSWLARIVTNQCLTRLRVKSRARMLYIDGVESRQGAAARFLSMAVDPECRLIQNQMVAIVRQEIRRMPSDLRCVVLLRDVQFLSMRDIAKSLGITVQAVKSRLFRARKELKQRVMQSCGVQAYCALRSSVQHLPAKSTRCSAILV
jgi:RNA polymerase sigma-70 factor (ECF subfamily)